MSDLEGLTYSVGGINYTIATKGAAVSDVDTWEKLSENQSGISMQIVLERDSLVHTLKVVGNYRYLPGKGWIQSGNIQIEVVQKITALISDDMITKAIEKLRVEYQDHEEPEEGMFFTGKVVSIKEFGAFIEFAPGKEGMVHISRIAKERIRTVEEVLTLGDIVKVVCLGKDKMGRMSFSIKDVEAYEAKAKN